MTLVHAAHGDPAKPLARRRGLVGSALSMVDERLAGRARTNAEGALQETQLRRRNRRYEEMEMLLLCTEANAVPVAAT